STCPTIRGRSTPTAGRWPTSGGSRRRGSRWRGSSSSSRTTARPPGRSRRSTRRWPARESLESGQQRGQGGLDLVLVRGVDHAAEDLLKAGILHARADVLVAVGGEQGRA